MYVPDRYKTYKVCDKVILENGAMQRFIPDCCKDHKIFGKSVDNYSHLEFVLDCYKTPKICNKVVDSYPSAIQFIPECYKTQERYDEAVNTCPFVFDSFLD